MHRSIPIAFCAALALACAGVASADPDNSRVVHYGDLDTFSDAGADALIGRIENAAGAVCGKDSGPRPVVMHSAVNTCADETTEVAVSDVANPVVSARFHGYEPSITIDEEAPVKQPKK